MVTEKIEGVDAEAMLTEPSLEDRAIREAHAQHKKMRPDCDAFEPTSATADGDEVVACNECDVVVLRW